MNPTYNLYASNNRPMLDNPTPDSLSLRTYRRVLVLSLVGITILGLIGKFYSGPGHSWVNDSFGGIPYEIFWMLLVAYLWPRVPTLWVAVGVLVATCGLEVLQLWQPLWLQAIRTTLPGRLVLGNSFSWGDFPYYVIGCGLGWLWLRSLQARYQR